MILASHLNALNGWYNNIDLERDLAQEPRFRTMERNLGLMFDPNLNEVGNVCMINASDVRNEYKESFITIDLLDYIYAMLHSSVYRNKYEETVDIDYSKVPYPKNLMVFWRLVSIGTQLRTLHLLESQIVGDCFDRYPLKGENFTTQKPFISKTEFKSNDSQNHTPLQEYEQQEQSEETATLIVDIHKPVGKLWVNKTQFFDNVPKRAWDFCMGGYRPAQKWIKDRYGHSLEFWEIQHYQKIIFALTETRRLMQEIDTIGK